jgi:hypothetical protein
MDEILVLINRVDLNNISVSNEIATVLDRFSGSNEKLVIHIQDSHANFQVQSNYAKTIESIIKTHF